jgi:carbon-monoxide dehydrogenase small subunit
VSVRVLALESTVNGRPVSLRAAPEALLLDVLREDLGLTGSKRSCDVQVCGACTVLLDGRPVSACSVLAYEARGREVLTIEGLATDERLHPVQEAFLAAAGFQCGYCTPGMIMAVKALLDETPAATPEEVRNYLRGNICRCTGYVAILEAVTAAQRALALSRPSGASGGSP